MKSWKLENISHNPSRIISLWLLLITLCALIGSTYQNAYWWVGAIAWLICLLSNLFRFGKEELVPQSEIDLFIGSGCLSYGTFTLFSEVQASLAFIVMGLYFIHYYWVK